MKIKEFVKVEIGNVYVRRDGRAAFVYMYDAVFNQFKCIIPHSGEIFYVHEDGMYRQTEESHNDLIGFVK